MKEGCGAARPSGITLTVLASGSKGNCLHIDDGETALLVDAGFSCKELLRRMDSVGISAQGLSAIVLSHEHGDHVTGAGVLSRKLHIPVYGTSATLDAAKERTGCLHQKREITCGVPFAIGSLLIHPFSIPHDAADPTGFTVSSQDIKIGIATDLGVATTLVKSHLRGCHALVLEANHCPEMLDKGPYPWPLKQRVKGRTGHLSNESARDLLQDLLHRDLSQVVIAHLSEQNNQPERACRVVGQALAHSSANLMVACQARPLPPVRVEKAPLSL
ncbi:MBL fold metallo-hydrolase [Desulfobotulus sp.]|jgi:phosphoribosyl 1,2-cyclic phosphodiesterase|uniref:MBL fold metallo-hydrolase n=1 Tax=Desulfobotulus sp. TaxID=1940337 RepID=UPI002A3607EF|nr:MBL fold metallo-hydrolase [Desulfobotulus sp.]MDY0163710.1 MBL fold metallo-hydrolase [Desulfobotulus sp.]